MAANVGAQDDVFRQWRANYPCVWSTGLLGVLALIQLSCATLASDGKGNVDLPTEALGPFRALKNNETCDELDVCKGLNELPPATPNGFVRYTRRPLLRSPSALVRGTGEKGDYRVIIYGARDKDDSSAATIVRMTSPDARDFDIPQDVITAEATVPGGLIGDPFAIDVDVGGKKQVWLYYAVRDVARTFGKLPGIYRAVSTDGDIGLTFAVDDQPALPEATGHLPRAPSVVRLPNGTFRMFYAVGNAIYEAESAAGVRFSRFGGTAVFAPSRVIDPKSLATGVKPNFDDAAVDDPHVERQVSATGRVVWHMIYAGRDVRGQGAIGVAGRFGDRGLFVRNDGPSLDDPTQPNAAPVFGAKLHANAPTLARFDAFTILYADQDFDRVQSIGIGISPQRVFLPYMKPVP